MKVSKWNDVCELIAKFHEDHKDEVSIRGSGMGREIITSTVDDIIKQVGGEHCYAARPNGTTSLDKWDVSDWLLGIYKRSHDFDKLLGAAAAVFENKKIRLKRIHSICGYVTDQDIELGDGVEIINPSNLEDCHDRKEMFKLDADGKQVFQSHDQIRHGYGSLCALTIDYEMPSFFLGGTNDERVAAAAVEEAVEAKYTIAINSIVLSVGHGVSLISYTDRLIEPEDGYYGLLNTVSHYDLPSSWPSCSTDASQSIQEMYNKISGFPSKDMRRLDMICSYLSKSLGCRRFEDKSINLGIAIELAAHGGKENTELSYRAALKLAYHTCSTKEERLTAFEYIKKAYKLRSMVVHRGSFDYKEENMLTVERASSIVHRYLKVCLDDYSFHEPIENYLL